MRLTTADGRLTPAIGLARQRLDSHLRVCASRLEALSPLAVLGRGYAVCWNLDRTTVLTDAGAVAPGDRVQVTLAHGEIVCDVRDVKT
jgi:exodeoxyribonuclease VII large subunit